MKMLLRLNNHQKKRIERYIEKAEELSKYLNDMTGIAECKGLRNAFNLTCINTEQQQL